MKNIGKLFVLVLMTSGISLSAANVTIQEVKSEEANVQTQKITEIAQEKRDLQSVIADGLVEIKDFALDHKTGIMLNLIGAGLLAAGLLAACENDKGKIANKFQVKGLIIAGSALWWSIILTKDAAWRKLILAKDAVNAYRSEKKETSEVTSEVK